MKRSEQLDRLNKELKRNAQRKDEFLATLAHELRNPLSAIYNSINLLDTSYSAHNSRLVEILTRQTSILRQMVDDLLDLSRIDRGLINLQQGIVDVVEVAEHAMEAVRFQVYQRRHELKVILPREPLHVAGDAIRLEQVLVNLLTNAIKYTDPGGCIELHLKRVDSLAQIWVCDDGIGISPDLLGRIFDLFGQGEQDLARSKGGLGIGLNVVKNLVEMHNGSIVAHSKGLGKGAEFCVSLPLTQAQPKQIEPSINSKMNALGLDILLVEDNADVAETMRLLLQNEGHRVTVAYDGTTAIDQAQIQIPDLVILDIGLPGIDGYELARRLRANKETKQTALVALTGYGRSGDVQRAKEAGINHHFTKPVNFPELSALIATLAESA